MKMSKPNNKIIKISKYTSYFENKNNLLIFLLILIGVLVPVFSGSTSFNFWYKLYSILTSAFFNMMFFLAIGVNVISLSAELSKSYNIISRYADYKVLIKNFIKDIVATTLILSLVAIILSVSGAIILSFGDFSMITHERYNIPIVIYLIFFAIRNSIFACIINVIIYMLFLSLKKIFTMIIILFINILFVLLPSHTTVISHFYNVPYLYHYYFMEVPYYSFFLELICSILQLIILIAVYKILFRIVILKKRDLL